MLHTWLVRKALQSYWRFSRPLTMGAQALVLEGEERVLLVRHGYRPGWHLPGGGVEKNETIRTALRRELLEETGVEPLAEPEFFAMYANFTAFPSDHVALFIVRDWARPSIPKPNAEIVEQGFFDVNSLPQGTVPAVRRRLDEILAGQMPDEHW